MFNDESLKQDVVDELAWDPSVDDRHVGVSVNEGVVTLSGHVDSWISKQNARRAAEKVKGVKGVAMDLEIRLPGQGLASDDQLAERAVRSLSWDSSVPRDRVEVTVENRIATLNGNVDWYYQKQAAERTVGKLMGLAGVSNRIEIKPQIQVPDVQKKIERALKRDAELDASQIRISAKDHAITLEGRVDSWGDRRIAENAAWAAPGVTQVNNHLMIG